MKVFKYVLPVMDYAELQMPKDSKVLSVANQNDQIVLYAQVGDVHDLEIRRFRIAGTGHEIIDDNLNFIGAVMMLGGKLVFHVFEIIKETEN